MHLLDSALLPTQSARGRALLSLPQLFASWGAGKPLELCGLKPHQRPVVETALAQLAAHALDVAGTESTSLSTDAWTMALQALADHECAPNFWNLVVEDCAQAAFCQPALSAPALLKKETRTVLQFDTLVDSKNHDIKQDAHATPALADWVYALLTFQCSVGYTGASLYGIARMNGGFGTRVFFAAYSDNTQGGRWREDVARLRAHWEQVLSDDVYGFSPTGIRMLAATPWDGESGVQLTDLHPGFVEVARPVRLVSKEGVLTALYGGTKSARIAGLDGLGGNVADPWTPLVLPKPKKNSPAAETTSIKALSPGEAGFGWKTFLDLVFHEPAYRFSRFAYAPRPGEPAHMRLAALSRGQGVTSGYQDFHVTLPGKVTKRLFGGPAAVDARNQLLALKAEAAQVAEKVVNRTLFAYLRAHAPADDSVDVAELRKKPLHQKNSDSLRAAAVQNWQANLLPWLCAAVENDAAPVDALQQWAADLLAYARGQLTGLFMPSPGSNRATTLRLAKGLGSLPRTLADLK